MDKTDYLTDRPFLGKSAMNHSNLTTCFFFAYAIECSDIERYTCSSVCLSKRPQNRAIANTIPRSE
jgi:hypothetical protein